MALADCSSAKPITETRLPDGTAIAINDHVFLASEHLGEPYYIGRVMEFCEAPHRRGLHARIAWYSRAKDVMARKSQDARLLMATMHSDLNPVSSIRGKCTVTHKHYIPRQQLYDYKSKDNHFFFHQLYDRYMQRVYDIIPCELVQNVPKDIQRALNERYQFVVVEQGRGADLTDTRRTCCVCTDWCASTNSVKCAACQNNYHMACVQPPLARKPSKGFAWQCAFCTRHELAQHVPSDSQSHQDNSEQSPPPATSPNGSADPPDAPRRRITRQASRTQQSQVTTPVKTKEVKLRLEPSTDTNNNSSNTSNSNTAATTNGQPMRTTNMWPFRYFGIHNDIQDILDIDARIYPRARSRIGSRYQADVQPSVNTQHTSNIRQTSPRAKLAERRGRPRQKKQSATASGPDSNATSPVPVRDPQYEPVVRGTPETVTPVFSQIDRLSDDQVDRYMEAVKTLPSLPLPPHSSDLMDRALLELERHNYNDAAALQAMVQLDATAFPFLVQWSKEETNAFEDGIRTHGHDLFQVAKRVPTKSHADVVRFFYQWKKTDRYEPVYAEWTQIYKPAKEFNKAAKRDQHSSTSESGEESDPTVVRTSTQAKKAFQCFHCHTTESSVWRRLPSDTDRKRKHFHHVLCNSCGEYWLKYGVMQQLHDKSSVGRKGRMAKSSAAHTASSGTTSPSGTAPASPVALGKRKRVAEPAKKCKDGQDASLPFDPSPCAVCDSMNPQTRLLTCHDCGMSAHDDCYGTNATQKEGWICDVCDNRRNPTASYIYECILCPDRTVKPRPALKKTSGYKWSHVSCAAFIPEVKFVNTETLQPVEYVGAVFPVRRKHACSLCGLKEGACVTCGDCKKPVHVQCAIKHKFTAAFEIQHVRSSCQAVCIPPGLFGAGSPGGMMVPQVWCPEHDVSKRRLVDLKTRTTSNNQSSLRTYAEFYKKVDTRSTPARRRYRGILASAGHPYNRVISNSTTQAPSADATTIPSARKSALVAMMKDLDNPPLPLPSRIDTRDTVATKPQPVCSTCPVVVSPMWWDADPENPVCNKKICHRCYWNKKKNKS